VFITTTGETPGTNRLEISGTLGKLLCEGEKLFWTKNETDSAVHSKTYHGGFTKPKRETVEVVTDGENPQHVGVLNAWGGAIARGEQLIAHGSEGINGLTLSNAMHLSSWLDRAVELPFDEDLFKS
jgi:hypothetical protein